MASAQLESQRRLYYVAAQRAAVGLRAAAEAEYTAGHLLQALPRFELAKQLATDPDWKDDPDLQRSIDNIRSDIDHVAREVARGDIRSWVSFSRFVLNQDTGGAITGPGRVDLFCGRGREAEITAGHLKEEGELYFLILKKVKK